MMVLVLCGVLLELSKEISLQCTKCIGIDFLKPREELFNGLAKKKALPEGIKYKILH